MQQYGLIGYPLGHSFSQQYFTEKFVAENIADARYDLFPLADISDFPKLIAAHPELKGLNITSPHKVAVIPYLDELDETALAVGAVNTIRFWQGRRIGFNSDVLGLEASLRRLDQGEWLSAETDKSALILGTGGAAKAVAYVLKKAGISYHFVSRAPGQNNSYIYTDLPRLNFKKIRLIFNATPAGTYPNTKTCPDLPFDQLHEAQLVYDLVYNPAETLLLHRAKAQGAAVKNGLEMLQLQAEAAWAIWQRV